MSSSTFKILFYIRGNYFNKDGKSPIMIRITLNGEIAQFNSKLSIEQSQWDSKSGKARGRNTESIKMNALLDNIRASLTNYYHETIQKDGYTSPKKIRDIFLGKTVSQETLLLIFRKYNDRLNALIKNNNKSPKTVEKYDRTLKRMEEFLLIKRELKDIPLREINYDFILDFENYLLVDCKYGHNTASKYMQYFRSVFLSAKNNGLVNTDPFHNYKITFKKVDLGYLEENEIRAIIEKEFIIKRLNQVKDIFIFCCYTGLAFIDVMNLTKDNIRKSFDDKMWIITKRHKTDIRVSVPILQIPEEILKKYEGVFPENQVLPKISNQKMNSYLVETAACQESESKRR